MPEKGERMMATVILAWLLINMWITLMIGSMMGDSICGWEDMAVLLLASILSPWVLMLIYRWEDNWRKK